MGEFPVKGKLHAVPLGRRLFFENGLAYAWEGEPPQRGGWVAAPLRHETVPAIVWWVDTQKDQPPPEPEALKHTLRPITGVLSGVAPLTEEEMALAAYLSRKYFTPLGVVLKNMTTFTDLRLAMCWQPGPQIEIHPALAKLAKKDLLTGQRLKNLAKKENTTVEDYLRRGFLTFAHTLKNPVLPPAGESPPLTAAAGPPLNPEQQAAFETVAQAMHRGEANTFLLEGVTGSGKTEVYLQLAEEALRAGRGALLLFPEIALTTQMLGRLSQRFGPRLVAFHSQQSGPQRARGQALVAARPQSVVIGPRSALFVRPFRPAVVILDEEHDPSYKQDADPRYLAHDVAAFVSRHHGAPLVLGSATPRLETRHQAQQGAITHLRLHQRHGGTNLPHIRLIDMRQAHQRGQRGSITPELKEAVQETLAMKKQALIFLNRRGYHTVVICRHCRHLMTCPHCSVALTLHQEKHREPRLRCHYCGEDQPQPTHCPACLSESLSRTGIGTQKAEEEIEAMFNAAAVARVDRDAVGPAQLEELFGRVQGGEVDILVGTQMLAKGLDFPLLHLVGVLDADRSMHLPDFRATERTFAHLVQVSGRSGRREDQGLVLIQTLLPDHPVFRAAVAHDYDAFYRFEIAQRQRHQYPPFANLIKVMVIHDDQQRVVRLSLGLKAQLEKIQAKMKERGKIFTLRGPTAAPLAKLKDDYRWQLSVKAGDFATAHQAVSLALKTLDSRQRPLIRVDVEPQDWL